SRPLRRSGLDTPGFLQARAQPSRGTSARRSTRPAVKGMPTVDRVGLVGPPGGEPIAAIHHGAEVRVRDLGVVAAARAKDAVLAWVAHDPVLMRDAPLVLDLAHPLPRSGELSNAAAQRGHVAPHLREKPDAVVLTSGALPKAEALLAERAVEVTLSEGGKVGIVLPEHEHMKRVRLVRDRGEPRLGVLGSEGETGAVVPRIDVVHLYAVKSLVGAHA